MKLFFDNFSPRTWAIFAGIYGGMVFGIYWIPLRVMDEAGIHGMWAVVVFNVVSFILILPVVARHWRVVWPGRMRVQISCMAGGFAYVLYIGAFLYTEVVRVLALFYLMPIWGFFLAHYIIGEHLTPVRWASMTIGLAGLMIICGNKYGIPIPSNIGDLMSLLAGILWAGVALSLLTDEKQPLVYSITFLFWGSFWAIVVALVVTEQGLIPEPHWTNLPNVLIWMIPFAILIIIPAAFATMYAPSQINPGLVGLLFMTEISVGTATAAWLSGEPFGIREVTGIMLITLAGVAEPMQQLFRTKKA